MRLYLNVALRVFLSVSLWTGRVLMPLAIVYLSTVLIFWPEHLDLLGRIGALCAAFGAGVLIHDFVEKRASRRREACEHDLPPA